MNQKTYLKIESKCPFCDFKNNNLITHQVFNEPNQKLEGDFIISGIESEMGFLNCYVICDSCNKRYNAKVGVNKSILISIVIVEKK